MVFMLRLTVEGFNIIYQEFVNDKTTYAKK